MISYLVSAIVILALLLIVLASSNGKQSEHIRQLENRIDKDQKEISDLSNKNYWLNKDVERLKGYKEKYDKTLLDYGDLIYHCNHTNSQIYNILSNIEEKTASIDDPNGSVLIDDEINDLTKNVCDAINHMKTINHVLYDEDYMDLIDKYDE